MSELETTRNNDLLNAKTKQNIFGCPNRKQRISFKKMELFKKKKGGLRIDQKTQRRLFNWLSWSDEKETTTSIRKHANELKVHEKTGRRTIKQDLSPNFKPLDHASWYNFLPNIGDIDTRLTKAWKAIDRLSIIWLITLFDGLSTPFRSFNTKAILLEEQYWYHLTHSWEDKGVHNFPKGICPKVNVVARLGYELTYYDSAVHRFNHYTTRTPPRSYGNQNLTDKMKRSFFQETIVSILLYGCTTWTPTKRLEKKLDGNYTRILRAILNKSWRQHENYPS